MLKHILAGQPSSGAGSRLQHHHNDFAPSSSNAAQHQQQHYSSGHPPPQQHRGPRAQSSADVYDGPNAGPGGGGGMLGQRAGPQYSSTRHALNHSQLSVNNLAHRLNASQHSHHTLNLSALSASKHSVNSSSPIVGAHLANYATRQQQHPTSRLAQQHPQSLAQQHQQHVQQQHHQVALQQRQDQNLDRSKLNGGLDISRLSRVQQQTQSSPSPVPQLGSSGPATTTTGTGTATATTTSTGPSVAPLNVSWSSSSICRTSGADKSGGSGGGLEPGLKEVLSSLGLLCLVSLLLALLSLTFLVRMSSVSFVPNSLISPEEFAIVYDVTLVLCVLALSLNLCCLLVCAIQFLFAVKLVKAPYHGQRTNKYLQKSSVSRVCAIGGFFISIPVFLTGMILYTFIQFQSTPAIVTSAFIGLGIIFCGCALVHTVFVWQKEKTNAMKALRREQYEAAAQLQRQQTLHTQQQQQQHSQPQQQPQQNQSQHQQQHSHHPPNQPQQHPRSIPAMYASNRHLGHSSHLHESHHHPHQQLHRDQHHQHQQQQQQQQQQHHPRVQLHNPALHSHRHVSMSPPLLISSPSQVLNTSLRGPPGGGGGGGGGGHHHQQQMMPGSPPASPGDRSPTSPGGHIPNNGKMMQHRREAAGSVSPGLPPATLDLSNAANTSPHELSTLV